MKISINTVIDTAYAKWRDRAYIFEKIQGTYTSITYGDFITRTKRLAKRLIDMGLQNKKVLIFGPNSINYMISDLAVLAYVGVSVNINAQSSVDELKEIIEIIGIDAVIYDEQMNSVISKVITQFPNIKFLSMQENIHSLKNGGCSFNFDEKDNEECSKIVFSSGTMSNPKGIMLSLKNIFSGWEALQLRTPFCEKDVDYLFLPLHHIYANICNFIYSLLSGMQIYLCSGIENIEKELQEVNPTVFCGVPLIYKRMYKKINNFPNAFGTNIKYMYCGGAKFDEEIRKEYKKRFPMFEAYALTETASSLSIEYPNKDDFESVGTIFENIDVKIINKNKNEVGDIVVKGDNVFLGYINNPQLTREAFTRDKYFITGDIGYIKKQ